MSKIIAALIAGLFAAGAYAQSQEAAPQTNSKAQAAAQAKVDAKPQGMVKKPAGDTANTQAAVGVPSDKANMAGEKRAETRDQRRRNKDGSMKKKTTQGGTPQ